METIKSHTDLKQSRKLAEILPPESADFHFSANLSSEGYLEKPIFGNPESVNYSAFPCWSLASLLDLMPQRIYDELGCRTFGMVKSWDKRRYQVFYEHKTAYIQREAETAIDAVFEMIIWLKENKKI